MKIIEYCLRTLLIATLFYLGICTASRSKRQIIFEDDNSNTLYNSDCVTPERRPGRCLRVSNCPALRNIGGNRLRRYLCGFEGREAKVCCPQPTTTTTERPRTVRTTISTTLRPRNEPRETPQVGGSAKPAFLPRSCGVTLFAKHRVVLGWEADSGSWPWMAVVYVLKSNNRWSPDCGGALVTNQHVVTAAHCVVTGRASRPLDVNRVRVRLGAHNIAIENEPGAVTVGVEAVRRHENFESRTYKNDIAVIKLDQPVTFNNRTSPVCLPYDSLRGEDLTGKPVYVIGYGTTTFNGNTSDVLMEARFDILSDEVCRRSYEPEIQFSRVYMCAGVLCDDICTDACQGDSGGPLVTTGLNNNYYLVGVVSFGKQCGRPNYPGVYTRVTEFLDWLTRNLSN